MKPSRICVQSLKHYVAGKLVFEWFDMDDIEEAKAYAARFEEAMLADMEGPISAIQSDVGEFLMWDTLETVYELLIEHGEEFQILIEQEVLANIDIDKIQRDGLMCYVYKDEDELGYEMHGQEIPEHYHSYVNFDLLGEDYLTNFDGFYVKRPRAIYVYDFS